MHSLYFDIKISSIDIGNHKVNPPGIRADLRLVLHFAVGERLIVQDDARNDQFVYTLYNLPKRRHAVLAVRGDCVLELTPQPIATGQSSLVSSDESLIECLDGGNMLRNFFAHKLF